jgi:hypothetical protein
MKRKSLKSIMRSNIKLKPALLRCFSSSRNMSNVKPLWLVCDYVPLSSNGDGPSSKSSRLIHLGSHSLATQVISPLSYPKSQNLGGPSHIFFS